MSLENSKDLVRQIDAGEDPNRDLKKAKEGVTDKAQAALALRIAGASYTTVAKQVGYARAFDARRAVERALANAAQSEEGIDKQRTLHMRRLERLLSSVMPTAVNVKSPDHLAYNARALAVLDRIALLGGLNAPQQQVVYTPRAEEIEKYVAHFAALAEQDQKVIEADVINQDENEVV